MEPINNVYFNLITVLQNLQGKSCWSFIGGSGTGSMITLDFGEKIPRKKPVNNRHLSLTQQNFMGEMRLFIKDAAWRVDSESAVICSSTSSNHKGGAYDNIRKLLVNRSVIAATASYPGVDLNIEFEGNIFLRVFCNQTNEVDNADNYSLHLLGKVFLIETFSHLKCIVKTSDDNQ